MHKRNPDPSFFSPLYVEFILDRVTVTRAKQRHVNDQLCAKCEPWRALSAGFVALRRKFPLAKPEHAVKAEPCRPAGARVGVQGINK